MLFKALTCILALVVVAEGGYIFLHRRTINRFKSVDDYGYAAFDSATGQLCRTFQARSAPRKIQSATSSARPAKLHSADPILDAMRNEADKSMPGKDAEVEFVRGLPACADIR
jgi:hypothetical protein